MVEQIAIKPFQTEVQNEHIEFQPKYTEKSERPLYKDIILENQEFDNKSNDLTNDSSKQISFSFERKKLENLKIIQNDQIDFDDNKVEKLKDEIIQKITDAKNDYVGHSLLLKIFGIIMLGIDICEIIFSGIMCLILAIHHTPTNLICIWLVSDILLTIIHIILCYKSSSYKPTKEISEIQEFHCKIKIYTGIIIGTICITIISIVLLGKENYDDFEDYHEKLYLSKIVLICGIIAKIISVSMILYVSWKLTKFIEIIPADLQKNIVDEN